MTDIKRRLARLDGGANLPVAEMTDAQLWRVLAASQPEQPRTFLDRAAGAAGAELDGLLQQIVEHHDKAKERSA